MAKAANQFVVADEVVMNKIYYIRKQKVMLDRDLWQRCTAYNRYD